LPRRQIPGENPTLIERFEEDMRLILRDRLHLEEDRCGPKERRKAVSEMTRRACNTFLAAGLEPQYETQLRVYGAYESASVPLAAVQISRGFQLSNPAIIVRDLCVQSQHARRDLQEVLKHGVYSNRVIAGSMQ
jgi:hypothetical protein